MNPNPTTVHDWAMVGVLGLGGVLVLAVILFLWQANRSADSPFDAAQMFQDERQRTSGPRLAYVIGAFTGVWVMVYLTIDGKMNAETIGVILGILMLGKVGSQYLDTKAPPQPASEEMTIRRTAATKAPKPVDDVPTLTDAVPDPRRRGKS